MTLPVFPSDPKDKKVLGVMFGGIGDCLMIANVCSPITNFTFAVQPHQMEIVSKIKGCETVPIDYFRNPDNQRKYDSAINFMYFLSFGSSLKSGDYYGLIEKKIGYESPLAGMDIDHKPKEGIYVHMQASNPNRDWTRERWSQTLTELAKVDTVYLLGRLADFALEGPNIVHLAKESEDLVWQAEKLSTGKYFLGVDSGFCHIAGIIGVPGSVIFTNTLPDDVICRYPSLDGIDKFEGKIPTRTTRVPCEISEGYKLKITPEAVIQRVKERYN